MIAKRSFDFLLSLIVLFSLSGIIVLAFIIASIDTRSVGLFIQNRIGQNGKSFKIFKIKTVNDVTKKVTPFGRFLRNSKLDEFPQATNILLGQMSFVGPRPDLPGYADLLSGDDRLLLTVKPGLTGLASLKYRNEESLLAQQLHPLQYNDKIIWPDKIRLNTWYAKHHTFLMDLEILYYTLLPFLSFDVERYIENYDHKKIEK